MDDIEDTNYKFNSQDIENIWYIFFCLADSTFSSVYVSYGKKRTIYVIRRDNDVNM